MNSIIWKGVSSTTIKGLIINELPPISKPEMRVMETVIDGRNGSVIENLGFNAYDKPITISLHRDYDINEVIKYFTGEGEVVFSNEPDKVYRAKIFSQIDYNRLLRYRQATIVFRTQPFKYAFNEELSATEMSSASGTSIVVNDSENANLKEFKIYGKSTQNGTPTPDSPVDIVSVGDDGTLKCDIYGKNLIEPKMADSTRNEITVTNNGDGSFTINGTATSTASFRLNQSIANGLDNLKSYKGNYCLSLRDANGNKNPEGLMLFLVQSSDWQNYLGSVTKPTAYIDVTDSFVYLHIEAGVTFSNFVIYPQLEEGSSVTNWEKPIVNSVEFTLDHPLRAVQVTDESLATYTDAEGKMWCADEIDLERGVSVQRINALVFDGSEAVSNINGDYSIELPEESHNLNTHKQCLCNYYPAKSRAEIYTMATQTDVCGASASYQHARFVDTLNFPSVDINGFKTTLAERYNNGKPVVLYYILLTPIETPLTEEQIAFCENLKANNPTTTIFNDENAYMSVEYLKPFEVENKGLETSYPKMTITGNGTVEISVNGVGIFSYTFPEDENQVVIDSEKEDAYLGAELKNRNMNGEFPVLQPGINKIEWTGDVEGIEIEPRSRWL